MLALAGYIAGRGFFGAITSDPELATAGLSYLHAALPALPVLGMLFAFSAYRNGAGTPRHSLLPVAVQLPCALLFGYLLVFGAFGLPRLGAAGAGLGLSLSAVVALSVHGLLALRIAPVPGLFRRRPSRQGMLLILGIGLPVGLQQSFVYLGSAVFFAIVGRLGSAEVAAMNVVLTTMLLSILPASGMGIAAATLVGSALGRGDAGDARRWGWQVAALGAAVILAFGVIVAVLPHHLLGLFVADRTTVDLAAAPLAIMALAMPIDAFGRILGFAMRGAGATRLVTALAICLQWMVQLPLVWFVGVSLGFGLPGVALVRLAVFTTESAIVTMAWRSGFWIGARIRRSSTNSKFRS